jgi:ZIP family zinc transporter
MPSNYGFALLLSFLAGISTLVGSVIGLHVKKCSPRLMTLTMGFSGGVMILVSFGELLPESIKVLGYGPAIVTFFAGMLGMFLIDVLIPHAYAGECNVNEQQQMDQRLLKAGIFTAVGIAIHNFPEGMATFAGALQDPSLGIAIAVAIAVHNIPEGLAVSIPVFSATKSRKKAFFYSAIPGLAEPAGAALCALILFPFLNPQVLAYALAAVAGIMVFISLDELVPVSRAYGEEHLSIVGIIAGMMVMAFSLYILMP